MNVNVYIDGFNLYYGAIRGTPYKWLDLRSMSEKVAPSHNVNRVRYFTARVQPRANDPQMAQRQQTFLRALETLPGLTIHYGHFLVSHVRMPLASPPMTGARTVEVVRTEEKGSDVNLATYLLFDAFKADYDMAVVISNDSDLVEPIQLVQSEFGLAVGVVNPHRTMSHALRKVAAFYRPLRQGVLQSSLLPDPVTDARGEIRKPSGW